MRLNNTFGESNRVDLIKINARKLSQNMPHQYLNVFSILDGICHNMKGKIYKLDNFSVYQTSLLEVLCDLGNKLWDICQNQHLPIFLAKICDK